MTVFSTRNPATDELVRTYDVHGPDEVESRLQRVYDAWRALRDITVEERAVMLGRLAKHFEENVDRYAALVTQEMGRPLVEARPEILKCAVTCRVVAERGVDWLRPLRVDTEVRSSVVRFESLGPILAVMPWNFPFFQVIRFFAPAFLAGNTALVKHAENVPACAEALEEAFASMGAPEGTLLNVRVERDAVGALIEDARIRSVTFTGSVAAGRTVAKQAGAAGKKSVLELGGSDPFVVLGDADLDVAVPGAVQARFANAGQSCICGKRFLVHADIAEDFLHRFAEQAGRIVVGDPTDEATTMGPLARADLRDALHAQVERSIAMGARAFLEGGPVEGPGYFYRPTILVDVPEDAPAGCQELFGPVASVFTFRSDDEALALANSTSFGLGSSVWTRDDQRAARFVDGIEAGAVFVNDVVRSDARLSFGGVKASGFGRELGLLGSREFTNAKMVWIA
ncbi:MAG: succinate-semialdehyde dehydrogenase [Actinomycetota bacterium]|jgi:acyl-CoA reductase-like NAD-dependent aldehyde dehydrogenase|nr:succinate-semialdehyde dehydrogenase [Actinomycetota bacterium]